MEHVENAVRSAPLRVSSWAVVAASMDGISDHDHPVPGHPDDEPFTDDDGEPSDDEAFVADDDAFEEDDEFDDDEYLPPNAIYLSTQPVVRLDDGTIFVNLPPVMRDVLGLAIDDLRRRMADGDDTTRRLFPTAYPEHPDLDAEYQRLMRDELLLARLTAIDTVTDTLHAETLTVEQASAWMQVFNAMRLSLGTELGVDHDEWRLPDDDPRVDLYDLYSYLGIIVGSIVRAMRSSG